LGLAAAIFHLLNVSLCACFLALCGASGGE